MIPDAAADRTDHSNEISRVKETGTETMMVIVAVTVITIVAETVILTVITILSAIGEEIGMQTEIADAITMSPVLSNGLIPGLLTIQTVDVTISNCKNAALSFWLTGRKGNVKLFFGTNLGAWAPDGRKT